MIDIDKVIRDMDLNGNPSDHRIVVAKFTPKDYRIIWALWARLSVNN